THGHFGKVYIRKLPNNTGLSHRIVGGCASSHLELDDLLLFGQGIGNFNSNQVISTGHHFVPYRASARPERALTILLITLAKRLVAATPTNWLFASNSR